MLHVSSYSFLVFHMFTLERHARTTVTFPPCYCTDKHASSHVNKSTLYVYSKLQVNCTFNTSLTVDRYLVFYVMVKHLEQQLRKPLSILRLTLPLTLPWQPSLKMADHNISRPFPETLIYTLTLSYLHEVIQAFRNLTMLAPQTTINFVLNIFIQSF